MISGEWPEALRARHSEIHRAFSARAPQVHSGDAPLPQGLAWAMSEASERRYPGRRSQAASLPEWLEELESRRPLTMKEALMLMSGPVEGAQARRWADSGLSRRMLAGDVDQLERLLTHPSEAVSRGAVESLELPGVWAHLVRLERRRAWRGQAPMLPPGLLDTAELVLLAEDVTSGWDVAALTGARPWLDGLGLTSETTPGLVVLSAAEEAQALQRDPRRIRRLLSGGRGTELGAGYLAELVGTSRGCWPRLRSRWRARGRASRTRCPHSWRRRRRPWPVTGRGPSCGSAQGTCPPASSDRTPGLCGGGSPRR